MKMNDTYMAEVSWAPNKQTVYARLSVSQGDGIPLAIRATFQGIDGRSLTKGTMVEVQRTDPNDARYHRIIRIWEEVAKENIVHQITVQDVDAFKKHQLKEHQNMAMSKDRVRFFLGERYFQDDMSKIEGVLRKAFDLHINETRRLAHNSSGFWITCRPSQFARFMIYRNQAGITNGFMDLKAELIEMVETYGYAELAAVVGITREAAKRAAHALGFSGAEVAKRMRPVQPAPAEIDVSGNPA